jgi:hypothetical protein
MGFLELCEYIVIAYGVYLLAGLIISFLFSVVVAVFIVQEYKKQEKRFEQARDDIRHWNTRKE